MMINNVAFRVKKRAVNKRGDILVKRELDYVHRQGDVSERYSSDDITDDELKKAANGRNAFYRLIVSPRKMCDMEKLVHVMFAFISERNSCRKLKWVAYVHRDTDHPHIDSIIIPPLRRCHKTQNSEGDFDLSPYFCLHQLQPYLNGVLDAVWGKSSDEEIIKDYTDGVLKTGCSKIDFDIRRSCRPSRDINHPENIRKYIVFEDWSVANRKGIEGWKKPYMLQRLNVLVHDGLAKEITDHASGTKAWVLLKDFIYRKILKGKIEKHLSSLTAEEMKIVKKKTVRKDEIKRIVSRREGNHIISYIVESNSGELCYFERKDRASAGRKDRGNGNSLSRGDFVPQTQTNEIKASVMDLGLIGRKEEK